MRWNFNESDSPLGSASISFVVIGDLRGHGLSEPCCQGPWTWINYEITLNMEKAVTGCTHVARLTAGIVKDKVKQSCSVRKSDFKIRCVKLTSINSTCDISTPNPMFDHLLESSRWDDSNKWLNIGFGEEMGILEIKRHTSEALEIST